MAYHSLDPPINFMVKFHYILPHSLEWHAFRENGIGASEVSSVMATQSKILHSQVWTPPIKYYLSKVGEPVQEFTGNQASESGSYEEQFIINRFRYWDLENPDPMVMYRNMKENRRLNKVVQPKCYVTNSKYPHLFASPDGLLYNELPLAPGKLRRRWRRKALVEAKLTNSFEAGTYENRVSPSFVLQCYQNMMLLELEEAFLCILVDGIFFEVIRLVADEKMFKLIEYTTAKFWENVLRARIIKDSAGLAQYYNVNPSFLDDKQLAAVEELQKLEPALEGSEEELDFVREMCKPTPEFSEMIGTPEQDLTCQEYLRCGEEIAAINSRKFKATAELITSLQGFHVANFVKPGKGDKDETVKFSYKPDKNGEARIYVSPKFLAPVPAPIPPVTPTP